MRERGREKREGLTLSKEQEALQPFVFKWGDK